MLRKTVSGALILFVVAACSPSAPVPSESPLAGPTSQPTTAPIPSPTLPPTPEPTSTPIPVPFSELNLEPILIQDGDMPAGVSGAQVRKIAPEMFKDVPPADYTIYQEFSKDGEVKGGVTVFVFESLEKVESAYHEILSGMSDAKPSSHFGDKAVIDSFSLEMAGMTFEASDALFVRCHAVVQVRMGWTSFTDQIVAYAQRLDERLADSVCR